MFSNDSYELKQKVSYLQSKVIEQEKQIKELQGAVFPGSISKDVVKGQGFEPYSLIEHSFLYGIGSLLAAGIYYIMSLLDSNPTPEFITNYWFYIPLGFFFITVIKGLFYSLPDIFKRGS
ncbi:MAG TPA: hypothetical protein PKC68_00235 [Alphaproteobacteria bacterium]|nr:hypothetical protein [Alphaproteobacteria bacterium]